MFSSLCYVNARNTLAHYKRCNMGRPLSTQMRTHDHHTNRNPYLKHASLNSTSKGPGASSTASGASCSLGCSFISANMAPMSISDCFVSRYTVPRKLRGMDSCRGQGQTLHRPLAAQHRQHAGCLSFSQQCHCALPRHQNHATYCATRVWELANQGLRAS